MESKSNPTLTRRRQRRPDLQSTFDMPKDLQQLISHVAQQLLLLVPDMQGGSISTSAAANKVVSSTDKALHELVQPFLTPAQQLHAISKITGTIKDVPKPKLGPMLTAASGELYMWCRTLALGVVVPMLLDSRVRYLHRALMTLLRILMPSPDAATEAVVRDMYATRVLRKIDANAGANSLFTSTKSSTDAAAALYFPTASGDAIGNSCSDVASRDAVLSFLNSVDGLTSTLMPMMPSIFKDTFLEVLPLLAECFQWVVVNATSHICSQVRVSSVDAVGTDEDTSINQETETNLDESEQEGAINEEEGEAEMNTCGAEAASSQSKPGAIGSTVFGEDLEHIRFCVRVVATYIHKYIDSLTFAMLSDTTGHDVPQQLARFLQPTVVMLSSPIFPKDVLNAVGLLVASILTVRTCDGWLLSAVCAALRDDLTRAASTTAAATTEEEGKASPPASFATPAGPTARYSLKELFACAEVTLNIVCAVQPQVAAAADNGAGAKALHNLFSAFTPNGCFALLKGILAHASSPIREDWRSFGVLLSPQSNGDDASPVVVAYDIILPAAQQFCNVVQEPETRFMAIQTVDSVVRHVNAVLRTAATALRKAQNEAEKQSSPLSPTKPLSTSAKCAREDAALTEDLRRHLRALCTTTPKLQMMLTFSTQLIMALWDDGTQQMSGALYGTYNEILKISDTLRMCREQHLSDIDANTTTAAEDVGDGANTVVTLDQILDVQAERRGKYHALLGHMSMMPLNRFINVLQSYYHHDNSPCDAVAAFSRALLSGASNHKIGNVAGDVFAQLARAIKCAGTGAASTKTSTAAQRDVSENATLLLRKGIVEPLAKAITEKGYVSVSSNVSEAVNVSHITAHFVAPLVKQDPTLLQDILFTIVESNTPNASSNAFSNHTGNSHKFERVEQGVVEVLSRARGVGIDIVPFLAPGSTVLSVLGASTYSLNYDVRNTALCLCVLGSKKIHAVQPWQLLKVEEYLVLNMHLGGDSTARKGLLEMLKKWVHRLMESYASKGTKAAASESAQAAKKQRVEKQTAPQEKVTSTAAVGAASGVAEVLELGTAAYRHAVMQHCVKMAGIFAQNIGVSLRSSVGFAVERRLTAMMGYRILLQGLRTVVKDAHADESAWVAANNSASLQPQQSLLQLSVVPSLMSTLSDGWSQARDSARELLYLFCDLAPSAVFAEATAASNINNNSVAAASCAVMMHQAHQDLLKAHTYRNAEGAVQRFVLFATRSAEAQVNVQRYPLEELNRLNALLETERKSVMDKCAAMSAMSGSASYAYIQANPLHGSLSLCAELLVYMATVERKLARAPSMTEAADPTASAVHAEACTQLLECCCVVLRTCSSLVGTETVSAGATAGLGGNEVVDCRGHVYDRSCPEAECVMRGVVNNTWLSMRVATTAVDRVLKVRPVHLLPFDAVRATTYELVHALLLTKHNGVMRCVREALKTLTATLVRSRAPQFYQLPAELLAYLLGPEGVTSGDMARMLRRSQGLPHAILAVLEAEDTTVPYCLFPIAMRQLMRVAHGDFPLPKGTVSNSNNLGSTADDVRRSQRSNALNVMKFIFEDKVFADRAVAYIEEAFSLATEGFHDASWYTRNSSLMLFSAVIHRFVGEHPSTGGSGVNTSLHDVAKRTPRGVAYAYAELTGNNGLVGASTATTTITAATTSTAEVNMALFPVLQFLSMLSPDPPHLLTKASHSEWDDAARMSEAVLQCAGSPSLMVRSASAVALCCLVPIASLPRFIARAKRGLSLQPYEAPSKDQHKGGEQTEQQEMGKGSGANSAVGGGLNACHGALLQLLQFHAQYVGTLRRHYKQKRSSYATSTVAEMVCHAVCDVVLSCQAVLVRVCAVCPTVAAALFALLADLVYYGPQQHLSATQQGALRILCVSVLEAYLMSSQGVLERGSVMEGASAIIVFTAAQHRAPIGAWSTEERQRLTRVLHHEVAALGIRNGEHNLVSWIAAQLIHYSDDKIVCLDMEATASILRVLAGAVRYDISFLVLQSLNNFFASSPAGAACATPRAAITNIGGVACGQLVTHLRFVAMSISLSTSSMCDADGSNGIHQLYETVVAIFTSVAGTADNSTNINDIDAAVLVPERALWQNSDVCSAALDLVTCYDMYATSAHAISSRVVHMLAFCAAPEQPLESRLAVVKALRTAQAFLRRSVVAVISSKESVESSSSVSCPESAVALLVIMLRLLVDDTSTIREAASAICSHCVWGPQEAPRDQVSCLLAVVRLLRELYTAGQLTSTSAVGQSILAIAGVSAVGAAESREDEAANISTAVKADTDEGGEDETAQDDDHAENGEDVLFQKEADNMFAEKTVLLRLYGFIFGTDVSADVAGACGSFTVFDSILK